MSDSRYIADPGLSDADIDYDDYDFDSCDYCTCCTRSGCYRGPGSTWPTRDGESLCPCTETS